MAKWSDAASIRKAVQIKWDTGQILRQTLRGDGLFPLRIKLKGPTSEEMNTNFAEMLDWITGLKHVDKNARGFGYFLQEKEFHHRLSGKNTIPEYAIIPTLDDAVRLLDMQEALRLYKRNSELLLHDWSDLFDWVLRAPFQVITIGDDIYKILQVLRWFAEHEQRYSYLRELDIEGVDTKFIEARKGLFSQLLELILLPEQMNVAAKTFEEKFGLRTKPHLVRFRILDKSLALSGCTDITLPINQFGQLSIPFRRIFITENEINFLSFPQASDSCVIFGGGYRVDLLEKTPWLHAAEIYYWGDIDTHGLNILSQLRAVLPQTRSFFMNEELLLRYRLLWSEEKTPYPGVFSHLTPMEHDLALKLQAGAWGKGVRLEQERIRFSEVERFVSAL
jgi:hypothetical protein